MTDDGVWRIFIISILSGLMIKEWNHTLTILRGLDSSILLGCHYVLLDIAGGLWDLQELIDGQ